MKRGLLLAVAAMVLAGIPASALADDDAAQRDSGHLLDIPWAFASRAAPSSAVLRLSSRRAAPGTRVRLRGGRFAKRKRATIAFGGRRLRRVQTGRRGGLRTAIRVPRRAPGIYTVSARTGRRVARARFRIPVPRPTPTAAPAQAPQPQPPAPDPVTLVAAGDVACRTGAPPNGPTTPQCQHAATSDRVLALNPDVVAPLGDVQYEAPTIADGEYFQPGAYNDTWGRFKSISRPAIGNHEYQSDPGRESASAYSAYFGTTAGDPATYYYAYDIGDWRAIVLNTGALDSTLPGGVNQDEPDDCFPVSCDADSEQVQWLRTELASLPADKCVVAYWHHPRFDSLATFQYDELIPIYEALSDGGAELALVGHDHTYERFAPMDENGTVDQNFGVSQFLVGLGGKDRRFADPTPIAGSEHRESNQSGPGGTSLYGVLELELKRDSWVARLVGTDGAIRDQDSGSCHGRPPAP